MRDAIRSFDGKDIGEEPTTLYSMFHWIHPVFKIYTEIKPTDVSFFSFKTLPLLFQGNKTKLGEIQRNTLYIILTKFDLCSFFK